MGLVIAWSMPVWLAIAAFGWTAAGNTPRDGWSVVKLRLGMVAPPAGGRAAYTIGEQNWVGADLSAYGGRADERVTVVRQRTRMGLLVPWRETTDLRLVTTSGSLGNLYTGTDNPAWAGVLGVVRPAYAAGGTSQQRAVLEAIDAELAGALPRTRIDRWSLALECVVLVAHAMVLAGVLSVIGAVRRHRLVLERRARGVCLNCGYAHSGVLGTCPECGVRMRRRYHFP